MKYYIYISDTKVDMLYPQIPKSLLKKIASSLNIDLKLLGAEVNIGAKESSGNNIGNWHFVKEAPEPVRSFDSGKVIP